MSYIRGLRPEEVKFEVNCTEDTEEPDEEMFSDPECLKWIHAELARGNQWAFCTVIVRATWNGFSGTQSLSGCSYESKEDFIESNDYYEDMCLEAMNNLQATLDGLAERLEPLVTEESINEWACKKVHAA